MPPSSLARDIKKTHPFDLPEEEAYLNLWRAFAGLSEGIERLLRAHGLCGTHYNVLRILAGEKSTTGDPLPVLEVRDRLITRVPDITRLVDKLEKLSLVKRDRGPGDRRVVLLSITPKGKRLVDRLAGPIAQTHRRQLGHMTRHDLDRLSSLLEQARAGLDPGEPPD